MIREEEWNGRSLATYKIDNDGSRYKSIEQRHGTANEMLIRVCYTASGYNYNASDPDNGYYWQQDLGCSETFVPDNGGGERMLGYQALHFHLDILVALAHSGPSIFCCPCW